jgi:hypothetical protein
MAKTAIVRVGVEADPSGLGSVRGQVNRSLNTMAAQFGTIRGLMTSAMALPAIGMLTSIVEARSEAREMAKDLMMPFSQALQGSKAYDIGRRMDVGQQMTALGLDEFLARSEQRKTEVDIAKGLQAQPTGDAEKAFGSIWELIKQTPAIIGNAFDVAFQDIGQGIYSDTDQAKLARLEFDTALALGTGQTDQLYQLNQQMLMVLKSIEQKTRNP